MLSAATLLAASCTLDTDYFSEYRDTNLLGNYDFGAAGQWALAPNTTGNPSDYMRWEDAATPGPDGVSPGYRLEIKNLIPNGDFEDTLANSATVAPWSMASPGGGSDTATFAQGQGGFATYSLFWAASGQDRQHNRVAGGAVHSAV